MAPKRVLGELIRKRTKAGDSFFVGHAEHARITLFYVETRLDTDGAPVEVWQLAVKPTRHHPAHETAPTPSRRAAGLANGQRPVSGGP